MGLARVLRTLSLPGSSLPFHSAKCERWKCVSSCLLLQRKTRDCAYSSPHMQISTLITLNWEHSSPARVSPRSLPLQTTISTLLAAPPGGEAMRASLRLQLPLQTRLTPSVAHQDKTGLACLDERPWVSPEAANGKIFNCGGKRNLAWRSSTQS